jgi:predicted O-methyltransferase YrrM
MNSVLSFCPALQSLVERNRAVGRTGKMFDHLAALSTVNNLYTINELVMRHAPVQTLEIGLAFGGSALAVANAHKALGRPPKKQHFAVDPFQKQLWDDSGIVVLEQAHLDQYVQHLADFSWMVLPPLIAKGETVDFVYIDGSHLFEDVFVDFFLVHRLLTKNGIIVFDDCSDPHVGKVCRFIRANASKQYSEIDLTSFRPKRARNFKYFLARKLGRVQMRAFRKTNTEENEWNYKLKQF